MIAGLSGLLLLSLGLDWIANLVPIFGTHSASSLDSGLLRLFSNLASWLTIFLLFLALYRWVPNTKVHWYATIWGAMITTIAWKVATTGFNWYVSSGLGSYSLVYGSLGAIVALLFLIFIVSMITLFGAHLSAAIDRWENEKNA
jgi:membrane protein